MRVLLPLVPPARVLRKHQFKSTMHAGPGRSDGQLERYSADRDDPERELLRSAASGRPACISETSISSEHETSHALSRGEGVCTASRSEFAERSASSDSTQLTDAQ
eukprot:1508756-Pleurochrysis_carterae.AAC.1